MTPDIPDWIEEHLEASWVKAIAGMNERRIMRGGEPMDEESREVQAQKMAFTYGYLAGFGFGARHGG